jgi:hypothetical protein
MTSLSKFFLILIAPLIASYLIPLVFYKSPVIGSFTNNEYIFKTYPSSLGYIVSAQILILLLICFFIISYSYKKIMNVNLFKYSSKEKIIDCRKLYYILIFLTIIGNIIFIFHNFFIIKNSLEQAIYQLSLLPILNVGIGFFILKNDESFKNKNKLIIYFIIFTNVILTIFIYSFTSRIAYALYAFIAIFTIFDFYHKKFKLKLISMIILIILLPPILALKVHIRENYFYDGKTRINLANFESEAPLFKSAEYPKTNLQNQIKDFNYFDRGNENNIRSIFVTNSDYLNYLSRRFAGRLNHLSSTVYIFSIFPYQYSYLGWEYWERIVTGIVPRIFWSNKPQNNSGNSLPQYIQLLPKYDISTSYNLNIFEEGIAIQGLLGCAVNCLIFSILALIIYTTATILGNLYLFILPMCIFTLANTEAGIFGVFNGALRTLLVYFLLIYVINYLAKNSHLDPEEDSGNKNLDC